MKNAGPRARGGPDPAVSYSRHTRLFQWAIRIMLIRIMLTVEAITPMAGYTLNKLGCDTPVNAYNCTICGVSLFMLIPVAMRT